MIAFFLRVTALCMALATLAACSKVSLDDSSPIQKLKPFPTRHAAPSTDRSAWFGDLHVHTGYSLDAFAFGTMATPDDAYRYALGGKLRHPVGYDMRLTRPLDFYAVTDHASLLGVGKEAGTPGTRLSDSFLLNNLKDLNRQENLTDESVRERSELFRPFIRKLFIADFFNLLDDEEMDSVSVSAWQDTIAAADRFYRPGEFTTFAGYEYSSSNRVGSLHRNVIFRSTMGVADTPFSRLDSENPEDLWDWMERQRGTGSDVLAIPHNSNGSGGQMFQLTDWAGDPMSDDYSIKRLRNEPLVEITQIKGTSETHPQLSTRDEWANFEISPFRAGTVEPTGPEGNYAREALRNGIALDASGQGNPYRFGFIGSSDTHVGGAGFREDQHKSKAGLIDGTPMRRGITPINDPDLIETIANGGETTIYTDDKGQKFVDGKIPTWSASGLAGVWAEKNTRESIFDAMRRKETFATSGPRIRLRIFAGYDLPSTLPDQVDAISLAYKLASPMGSDLVAKGDKPPSFFLWAVQDMESAPLQRMQVIKGWEKNGVTQERVFDVSCADGLSVNPATNRCPDNGASVNVEDCSISADHGAAELKGMWSDPEFDPQARAFYYLRVLENPTCRWSTWQANEAGLAPRSDLAKTLQERAWSSPIWYLPEGENVVLSEN